tara:strand:+ start:3712 stop:4191 length:480 start_codon:yes stop_codon:yes gene_type:complete
MKPRFEAVSYEVKQMLEKAEQLSTRIEILSKAKCDCGKTPCECKGCPKCKGGKLNKAGQCMKADCNTKMEKADPLADPKPLPKEKITDINPHLVTESGGQTKTSYYTTNGNTIEYEDGKPKRDKHDKKVDLSKLGGRMNPHAGTGAEREDAEGGSERRY